jgi:RNA polymerase sigma factor (sigma-70 family)
VTTFPIGHALYYGAITFSETVDSMAAPGSSALPGLLKSVLSASLSRHSDRQLLERFVRSGDEAAFAAILDRHGPMVLGLCRRLLSDVHLADDVLQATFLVLARKAGSIRQRDNLAGWLYGVAQRLARQARLAEATRTRRERRAATERGSAAAGDAGCRELLRVLDEELQRLPERYRVPLLLCYLEGQTQDEAATQLGLSLSTLRRRLEKGRESLRKRMTRRGATLGAGLFASFLISSTAGAALTAELRQAVLTGALAVIKGVAVSSSAWMLAEGGMRLATIYKICLWSALAVVIGGGVAGVVWQAQPAVDTPNRSFPAGQVNLPNQAGDTHHSGQAQKSPAPRDRFNDPLPSGAIARGGTLAFRHGRINWGGSLAFTADGKHLVSTGGGWVRRWDLASGDAIMTFGDGWRDDSPGSDLATPDGKLARICTSVALANGVPNRLTQQCTEYDLEAGTQRTYHFEFPRDQQGHTLPTLLSPDGKTFSELNDRGTLTLWNAVDGTVLHSLQPTGGAYTAVCFPRGGKNVVVGDDTHTIRVFALATGKEQRSFGIFDGNVVYRMAISPDGRWLVTAGGQRAKNPPVWPHDRFFRLWDFEKGEVVRTIEFPEDSDVKSLQFTVDSRTLIAGTRGYKNGARAAVRFWDVFTGKLVRAWTDDPARGLVVAVSPDEKVLATLNEDGVIRLWDIETGRETRPLEASPCGLESVCFRPDGKTLLTLGEDSVLRDWETTTGRLLGPPRALQRLGFQPMFAARKLVLNTFAKDDGTMMAQLYESASGKLILEEPGYSPVVSPDGRRLAAGHKDRRVRIFDIESGKVIQTLASPAAGKTSELLHPLPRGFTSDGKSLINQSENLTVWDVQTGTQKTSWSLLKDKVFEKAPGRNEHSLERIESAAVSPDGSKVAFSLIKDRPEQDGDWFGQVMLLETATGKVLLRDDLGAEPFGPITFSDDGKFLASGGTWTIRVWDVATGKESRRFEGHLGQIKSLAFSPDGKRLASASRDSTVLVWDVSPRRMPAEMSGGAP